MLEQSAAAPAATADARAGLDAMLDDLPIISSFRQAGAVCYAYRYFRHCHDTARVRHGSRFEEVAEAAARKEPLI